MDGDVGRAQKPIFNQKRETDWGGDCTGGGELHGEGGVRVQEKVIYKDLAS